MTETIEAVGRAPFVAHHTEVDAVRTVWADLPGDPVLTLMFGVGHEDATPATAGITHLVEHLVMRRVGYVAVPHNAESTMRSTSFYAVGAPDQRADFVTRVCEAVTWLCELTDADLDTERQTILAEVGLPGIYAARDAFATRYGLAGLGLGMVTHARLLDWTAAEVREVAARWFHRDNAYLVSTTPVPAGVRLTLPDGPPVVRAAEPVPVLTGRAWCDHDSSELVLSGTCSGQWHDTHRTLASAVVSDLLHASLRTSLGQVYSVTPITMLLGATDLWTFALDPGPEQVCDVLVAALDVLERLAVQGPTPDELDRTRTTFLHELDLTAMRASWLDLFASYALRGLPVATVEEARAAAATLTADDVRAMAAELVDSLLVTLPGGHAPHDEAFARLEAFGAAPVELFPDPQGRTGWAFAQALVLDSDRGTTLSVLLGGNRFHRGKYFSPARGLRLVLLPDRFVLELPDRFWTIPYADIALAGTDRDGDVEIVTTRGGVITLDPREFRGLARRFETVLAGLPAGVRYRKDRTAPAAPGA